MTGEVKTEIAMVTNIVERRILSRTVLPITFVTVVDVEMNECSSKCKFMSINDGEPKG